MTIASNEELMNQAAAGNTAAFSMLVERLWWVAVRYAVSCSRDISKAEDLAQEAFLRLYLHRERYEPRAQVHTLLYQIIANLSVDYSRSTNSRTQAVSRLAALARPSPAAPCPQQILDTKEDVESLYAALGHLTNDQRRLIVLREFQGMSYRQLATATGLSLDSVRVQLHRARRRLYDLLRGRCDAAGGPNERDVHLG